RHPNVPIVCSHEVWPQIREYERTIVTALNAYVRPRVVRYLERLEDGLAAAVIGATHVCRQSGYGNLITLDMGGTSADIALVRDGQPTYSTDEVVGDFPVVMPAVGVSSIGAGGGSIAWLDNTGILKVGPQSAGSDPGPACYGRGGQSPTLSDAFLLCGFLNHETFLGGRLRLHPDRAAAAVR